LAFASLRLTQNAIATLNPIWTFAKVGNAASVGGRVVLTKIAGTILSALTLISAVMTTSSRVEATTLSGSLTADNVLVAAISTNDSVFGTQLGPQHENFGVLLDISTPLIAGTIYYLHIIAVNGLGVPHNPESGNPDGFIGRFTLSDAGFAFANGTPSLGTEDSTNWRAHILDDGWVLPTGTPILRAANGPNGFGWPTFASLGDAEWIWGPNPETVGRALFSTTIVPLATSEVPLPAALPLFAGCLAGLGLLGWRRRRTT
jgi:hypothetical protein